MKNSKLLFYAFIQSLGVFIYVALVALLMSNGKNLFGEFSGAWGPIAMLLLFVLSALITATIILLRPIHFYLDGFKKDAVKLLFLNILILFLITLLVFILIIFI